MCECIWIGSPDLNAMFDTSVSGLGFVSEIEKPIIILITILDYI